MTRDELKQHCAKQVEECEKWARYRGTTPESKIYEEHKLTLSIIEELDRAKTLLQATVDLLNKQNESPYVLNMLTTTVHYDDAECDGECLIEDIEIWMDGLEEG